MGTNPSQVVDKAKRASDAAHERMQQNVAITRASYEKFYQNLALFAGGTIASSVTYLGYLASAKKEVYFKGLLIPSWISLLICLVSALFYPFLYSHYFHFASIRQFVEKKKEKYEIELEVFPELSYAELSNPEDREEYRKSLEKAIMARHTDFEWNKTRENRFFKFWVWDGRLAQVSFVVGLVLLLSFVIVNN